MDNVSEALRDSCNVFFYTTGFRLASKDTGSYDDENGIKYIQKYASIYGLDQKSRVEIVEKTPSIATQYPVMAAIGQSNNNYTTVQLARYVTAVANEGTVYQYTLLNRLEDSDGNVLQTFEPQVRNQIDVLDTEEWNAIHSGMRMVVENTKEFDGFPIEAAGKTGTAQQTGHANHGLFVGYAPYDDPEITIAVRIANAYSSHNAATAARNVISYYYKETSMKDIKEMKAAGANGNIRNSVAD